MNPSALIHLIRSFVDFARHSQAPTPEGLARRLDELALAMHDVPDGEPAETELEPPARDYRTDYAALQVRFSSLGFYGTVDALAVTNPEPMMGDAADDLADIVGDLEEALWRYDHLGEADACWCLRLLYGAHWGQHLRDLSLYLHAKQFAPSEMEGD